jgi:MFS family permease
MENTWIIFTYSCVLRLLQGAASATMQTTCYAIATDDFPEQTDMIVGLVEAMQGFGLIIGPIIGTQLYAAVGL